MKDGAPVIVVGAGIGGLAAAIRLGAAGLRVRLLEASQRVGGKAGVVVLDGVEVDTGPSLLTLPSVFQELFALGGRELGRCLELIQPDPAFRYCFADGAEVALRPSLEESAREIERSLSPDAAEDFLAYLEHARRIWDAAAPHFVFAPAPSLRRLPTLGLAALRSFSQIDALSTLESGIARRVRDPRLRDLFRRFATYGGSDVRRAPGTLACIAHVELGLGGFGIRGGLHALANALAETARGLGVQVELGRRVDELVVSAGRIQGVRVADGEILSGRHVVLNADADALRIGLFGAAVGAAYGGPAPETTSMSGFNGVVRARRQRGRAAHTVFFPREYEQEFVDIFDRGRAPRAPAVYVCAGEVAHGRSGWAEHEALFVMVNAPALSARREAEPSERLQQYILGMLRERGDLQPGDDFVWWRTPEDLAREFPGSQGAIYGAAFHGPWAAFKRPGNEKLGVEGLYLASGSAHPGGGVPLAAQSGRCAADAVLRDWGRSV